jgi:hypothetical protein
LILLLALAPAIVRAQSIPSAVLAKAEPHHHLVYEDSTLRVLRVHVPPHDTTLLHEHDPDYFWIALGASEVVNARLGAPDATIKSEDLSIHYTPGHFAHVARNPGETPFDNITVELLQPQTNQRDACLAVIGSGGMTCWGGRPRAGVTERLAFQTDQLFVGLATIPPGAVMQATAESARVWLIALDTTDVGSSLVIDGPGAWRGGVFKQTAPGVWKVRNRGTSSIRVLTVVPLVRP